MTTHAGSDLTTAPRSAVWTAEWLLSPTLDLMFLVGSALVPLALLAAWWAGLLTALQILALWIVGFHGPHMWATASRTLVDRSWRASKRGRRQSAKARRWLLWAPLLGGTGIAVQAATGQPHLLQAFFLFGAVWSYQHIVQQTYGFMVLYRTKAGDVSRREQLMHKQWLFGSLWIPALLVLCTQPAWAGQIPFAAAFAEWMGRDAVVQLGAQLAAVCTFAFVALQVLAVLALLWKLMVGVPINLGETLVAATAVALHWFVVTTGLPQAAGVLERDPHAVLLAVPLITIFHDLQYEAFVWNYNRTEYRRPEHRGTLAAAVNRNLLRYVVCGIVFSVVLAGTAAWPAIGWPGLAGLLEDSTPLWVVELGAVVLLGVSFMHYALDGRIWKVHREPGLQRMLGLR